MNCNPIVIKKGVQNIPLNKYIPNEIIEDTNKVNPTERHKIFISGLPKKSRIRFNMLLYLYVY